MTESSDDLPTVTYKVIGAKPALLMRLLLAGAIVLVAWLVAPASALFPIVLLIDGLVIAAALRNFVVPGGDLTIGLNTENITLARGGRSLRVLPNEVELVVGSRSNTATLKATRLDQPLSVHYFLDRPTWERFLANVERVQRGEPPV